MPERDPRDALLGEGLAGYLDACNALTAFVREVQESAKRVMSERIDQLSQVTDQNQFVEQIWLVRQDPPKEGLIAIGAGVNAQETWGVRCGIKWEEATRRDERLLVFASCTVQVSAQRKRENLLRQIVAGKSQVQGLPSDLSVRSHFKWAHEVQLDLPLTVGCTHDTLEQRLRDALSAFVELTKAAGGLKSGISDKEGS